MFKNECNYNSAAQLRGSLNFKFLTVDYIIKGEGIRANYVMCSAKIALPPFSA